MDKMRIAVIGCGVIGGTQHIKAYAGNPGAEIACLVDMRKERADEWAARYNVPRTESDYRALLDDPGIDAVSVCTPNASHAEISIAFLNAGKHVLCEKPAAVNMEQVRAMKEAADRSGCILNIGVVNRFNVAVNKIKSMIEEGELGRVYHVYCSFRAHRSIPGLGGPFTSLAHSGGGVLIDWGVHFLDLIFYCLGEPAIRTVSGAVHREMAKDMREYAYLDMWAGPPNYEGVCDVEDFVTGLVRTDGATLSLNGAWAQNIGEAAMFVEFLGDKAGVKLQYGGDFKLYGTKNGGLYETALSFPKRDMFYDEIDGFLASARTGVKNQAHIDHVLVTSEVIDALYASARTGKEIVL